MRARQLETIRFDMGEKMKTTTTMRQVLRETLTPDYPDGPTAMQKSNLIAVYGIHLLDDFDDLETQLANAQKSIHANRNTMDYLVNALDDVQKKFTRARELLNTSPPPFALSSEYEEWYRSRDTFLKDTMEND